MTRSFPNPLGVRRLRHVALRTPDLSSARDFYERAWGLETVHEDEDRLALRGSGEEHHLVAFRRDPAHGLDHIAFSVASPSDIDRAASWLDKVGVGLEFEPGHWDHPGGGYRLGFRDLEGRAIMLVAEVEAVAPRSTDDARPIELSHVVFNTVDLEAAIEFWSDAMGFRVSDRSERQMAFMRCNSRHHSVAFNQHSWTSVNHIAYEVADIDSFMRGIGRLRHAGYQPLWGPGRHGPGNNAFAYFGDPVGYVPELTCGLVDIDEESWVPRVWLRVPDQSDLWGTAGPPTTEVRERMAGMPDPSAPGGAPQP